MCDSAACGLLGMWLEPSLVVGENKSIVLSNMLYIYKEDFVL